MADPIGTVGKGPPPDDLSLIYQGGENFMARMAALDAKRREHEVAFLNLKIGSDAKAALKGAQECLEEAERNRTATAKILADAQEKARKELEDASKEAQRVAAAAMDLRKKADEECAALRRNAEEYVAKTKTNADEVLKAARSKLATAQRAQAEANAAMTEAVSIRSAAETANRDADAKVKAFQNKVNKLNAALRAVT